MWLQSDTTEWAEFESQQSLPSTNFETGQVSQYENAHCSNSIFLSLNNTISHKKSNRTMVFPLHKHTQMAPNAENLRHVNYDYFSHVPCHCIDWKGNSKYPTWLSMREFHIPPISTWLRLSTVTITSLRILGTWVPASTFLCLIFKETLTYPNGYVQKPHSLNPTQSPLYFAELSSPLF